MSFNINSAIQSHTTVLSGQSNYATWSHQVCSLLTMAGWWTIIDGTSTHAAQADATAHATWISQDQQAQAMIAIFIHADMQHLQKDAYIATGAGVTHPSMSHDLWICLQRLYAPTGVTGQFEAFSEALHIRIHDPHESHGRNKEEIPNQINHLVNTFKRMSSAGLTLPKNLKVMILLNTLPYSYKPVTSTIIQTTTAADFTLDNVIPKIMSESQLCSSTNLRSLIHHITQEPAEANRTSVVERAPQSNETCSHCGKSHPSNHCWAKFGHSSQTPSNCGGNTSNRGKKPYNPNRSGSRKQKGKGRGTQNWKGKGTATGRRHC